ncbi:putative fatty acyl-CoA reductase CG8306 [Condylostylus longicornis]|uniref:putative fatty acyl-CoA reductase CG8306 n=1 Tax=Condylostylus longicornis TaxID=2530218 RepID=UPI00244DD976|nr:putative fatty acyl-CoA reductase CG8306 [Condylostylus longicornis]XP_055380231.1 putative fatty acyl-CoA reductase CG8306 [Condylostylus longicornis]
MTEEQSPLLEFYANKNIFITGATGFVGVCLIEKILRDIPNIGKLYVLLRPKKGKTIEERLEELKKNSVFNTYLESNSTDVFKKLVPIRGDVGSDDLGISSTDIEILADNVNIVFHSAATLDFFQSLKETTNINLLGTRRVMKLCKQMKNLLAVVHVSSAYVNSFLLETKEILYPRPDDPEKIISLSQSLKDEALKVLEPTFLKDHPNTYTFTKHLAEHEVNECSKLFPCAIVRPSMITAAWKEPCPGWTISKNGPQGFFMGASKGVIRRLPLDPKVIMDYIPVDIVVNQILVAGYYVWQEKQANPDKELELKIFHLTSSTYKPFRFETLTDKMNSYMHKYPLKSAAWYPHIKFVRSLFLFKVSAILFHFLPGYVLDFITRLIGGRPILIKLHTNVWNSLKTLERFIFTEWHFDNTQTLKLAKTLKPFDKQHFNIDIGELKWEEYFLNLHLGVRQYLNNESPKNMEAARKKNNILLAFHVAIQLLFYYLIWCSFGWIFGISNAKAALLLPIFYYLFSQL